MMKSTLKSFDNVKFMRQQGDKLSEKLSELTKDEAVRKLNFEIKTVTC
jgi:predicted metal-binding protein